MTPEDDAWPDLSGPHATKPGAPAGRRTVSPEAQGRGRGRGLDPLWIFGLAAVAATAAGIYLALDV